MLLGIGGVRALNWLGIPISTYHFNEGHAVFAGIEMIAERMERGSSFPEAWDEMRRRIVFTTHTPVKEGNEEHSLKDLRRMGACLQLSGAEMREIGGDPFNMTVAGLRLSRGANAVSELHGETSRADVGARRGSRADRLDHQRRAHRDVAGRAIRRRGRRAATRCGRRTRRHKRELIAEVERPQRARARSRCALFIGFARRAAAYKRSDLILRDEKRLRQLLDDARALLLFSGKAHPDDARRQGDRRPHGAGAGADTRGASCSSRTTTWALGAPAHPRLRRVAQQSGAPARGERHLGDEGGDERRAQRVSILDGWWPEGCEHGVNGWAIGDGESGDDETGPGRHSIDALESEVLPAWADRARWVDDDAGQHRDGDRSTSRPSAW